ncbi:MAG: hypothetical protein WC584_00365 [Candidatus Pacearchaeota archaeon]
MSAKIICPSCKKEKEHHAKGYCFNCYRKLSWKPKKMICKRCGREMALHSKGLCPGCYNFVFHLQKNKDWSRNKRHNISTELYKKITEKCVVCGFDKIVDLHHLDENNKNNLEENFIGLCPNHHKMIHDFKFRREIRDILKQKGFKLPEDIKIDFNSNKF